MTMPVPRKRNFSFVYPHIVLFLAFRMESFQTAERELFLCCRTNSERKNMLLKLARFLPSTKSDFQVLATSVVNTRCLNAFCLKLKLVLVDGLDCMATSTPNIYESCHLVRSRIHMDLEVVGFGKTALPTNPSLPFSII